MTYREIGEQFCLEINNLLEKNNIKAALVTGGGFAYDSIKYSDNQTLGDYDFMIIYDEVEDINNLITLLSLTSFKFDQRYTDLDLKLLADKQIDIIRLSGNYKGIKSTINLVPKKLISDICNFQENRQIRKISHGRNTSLFFAYGSDKMRIPVIFISPSFITEDEESHYIHLDFSFTIKNNNIYLGILADAILKGFNINYDAIDFQTLRSKFIQSIHQLFQKNPINSNNYISLYANHDYFPSYLISKLQEEFANLGIIANQSVNTTSVIEPIIFSDNFKINYPSKPFNFIKTKAYNSTFKQYILKMQNNEYNRQYLIDALGKFFGYLLSSFDGKEDYSKKDLIANIEVYGVNDLYLPNREKYSKKSIIKSFILELQKTYYKYNNELVRIYLILSLKMLSIIEQKNIYDVMNEFHINSNILNNSLMPIMDVNIIQQLQTFNEVGTYHNYTSKVMANYTLKEVELLKQYIPNKDAKIIDIMCGYGRIANILKKIGFQNITGIDMETYGFLGQIKDFTFIQDEFLKHNFTHQFDFAYSLYNCYSDINNFEQNLIKTYTILKPKGIFVVDCFNKDWRDEIDTKFYKILYEDQYWRLIIKRDYNKCTGMELTIYEIYYNNILYKSFAYEQAFFYTKDIETVVDNDIWDFGLLSSQKEATRTNNQKHILVLRKKL